MRTSNKYVLTGLLLLLFALIAYNYLLKAAYVSGRYKDPYQYYTTLKFNGFDTVDVNSTSAVNVKFVQGPFSVRVDSYAFGFSRIKQQGRCLKISAVFEREYVQNPNAYIVIVSCPKLARVNTNAIFIAGNKSVTDTIYREDWHMRQNLIEGFNEDSLSIRQYNGSAVILSGNHIRVLNAVTGLHPGSFSKTDILNNNLVQQATVDILNHSKFSLDSKAIQNLKYTLADSAKITFTGPLQNLINNPKSQQK